jgi:hypothetical protein
MDLTGQLGRRLLAVLAAALAAVALAGCEASGTYRSDNLDVNFGAPTNSGVIVRGSAGSP